MHCIVIHTLLTAMANDYGYDNVYIDCVGKAGDRISTSENFTTISKVLLIQIKKMLTFAFTDTTG